MQGQVVPGVRGHAQTGALPVLEPPKHAIPSGQVVPDGHPSTQTEPANQGVQLTTASPVAGTGQSATVVQGLRATPQPDARHVSRSLPHAQ